MSSRQLEAMTPAEREAEYNAFPDVFQRLGISKKAYVEGTREQAVLMQEWPKGFVGTAADLEGLDPFDPNATEA